MLRRSIVAAAVLAAVAPSVFAHHGWSSFDQEEPLYLEGSVKSVHWRNPHADAVVTVGNEVRVPADLSRREMPRQQTPVDSAALVAKVRVPPAAAGDWDVELAPISRMEAWGIAPLKAGDRVQLIGYAGVPGKPKLMRVEYLIVNEQAYGLRSSPVR